MDEKILLKTKISPPVIRKDIINRPALFEKLNISKLKTLVLVIAPAGFGKTTLINSWISNNPNNSGWLSIDTRDNDITIFIAYLAKVFSQLIDDIDDTFFDKVRNPISDDYLPFIHSLINKIYENENDLTIVLDDYHFIDSQKVHRVVEELIRNAPKNLHIIISSRADPPLQLTRLRLENAISEIRMDALRFNNQETREFIQSLLDENISDDLISELWKRTEGWAAGLQLAGISMREKPDKKTFIKKFSSENAYILDYFFDEVITLLPDETKNFLFQSSLLENFSIALCDFVLERKDSESQVEFLQRENIFISPLDESREWFRYHRLLRDLLAARSSNYIDLNKQALFSRASIFMEEHSYPFYAVEYAIQAGDYSRAVTLIENSSQDLLNLGQFKTLEKWLADIPDQFLNQKPNLIISRIWSEIISNYDYEKAKADINLLLDKYPDLHGIDDAVKAFISISEGNFLAGEEYAEKAIKKISDKESYFYTIALWCAGISQATGRDLNKAIDIMHDLYVLNIKKENYMIAVMTMSSIAKIHHRMGKFEKAKECYQNALDVARDMNGNFLPIAGEALMGLGDLEREMRLFSQAEDDILDGIELTNQWRDVAAMEGYLALAKLRFGEKEYESAFNALDKAMILAEKYDATDIDDRIIETQKAKFHFILGDMEYVHDWAKEVGYDAISPKDAIQNEHLMNLLLSREFIFYARYLLEMGKLDLADAWINIQIERFETMKKTDVLLELYLYKAYQLHLKDKEKDALVFLNRCVSMIEKTGFRSLVLDLDNKIINLFDRYRRKLPVSSFLEKYLKKDLEQRDTTLEIDKKIIEPLSEREKDVLRYLRSNLTTPEIAEQMLIGVNTVRTHIKNIYSKLGVHKRSAAVRVAKLNKIIS